MHDYFLSCPNGIYFLFSHERPCKYRPMSLECVTTNCDSRNYAHKAVRLIRQVAIGRAAWHPKSAAPLDVIHVSEFARSVAAPMLPAGVRHFVVPNPVDVEQRPRVAVDRNRDFVFIGRFTREKQGVLLAAAAAQVGVSATFLGDGPEAAAIRAANPDARVLPWGDAPMVERVLAGARALVFPSIWYETGGLVVAEALARGVPAIVGAATGARDLISDGENGLLCHPGDLTSLSHCLEILDDADTAERMGRTAFETYWKTPLTTAAHVDRLLPVYHTVLEGNGLEHVTGGRR